MTKPLLIAICLFLMFASCKKADTPAVVTAFSATIDGVTEDFSTNAIAQMSTGVAANSNLSITGASGTDYLSIAMSANATIAKGTTYTNTSTTGYLSILFTKGAVSGVSTGLYVTDTKGLYISTVTVTAISSTNIQGTFSGKLLFTDGVTVKTITAGTFNVAIK